MADTAARTMQLLTLLQRRRYWPGSELADRLGISTRTLRRDIDRLRSLGYTVGAAPGVEGGYQLGPGDDLAPLLLDDDEAVALAVTLHLAARDEGDLGEAAVGALSKLLAILPPDRRRRVDGLIGRTATGPEYRPAPPPLDVLTTVADACRDEVRLRFSYEAADGTRSERTVEPSGLVALHGRWYCVAWDLARADWRTFRLDRMSGPEPTRTPVPRRTPPSEDLHAYVRNSIREMSGRHHVIIDADVPADEVERRWGRWVDVTAVAPNRSRIEFHTDTFRWPIVLLAEMDVPCEIVGPAELRDEMRAVSERFAASATGTGPTTHR